MGPVMVRVPDLTAILSVLLLTESSVEESSPAVVFAPPSVKVTDASLARVTMVVPIIVK